MIKYNELKTGDYVLAKSDLARHGTSEVTDFNHE